MDSAIAPTYNLRPEQKLQNHTEYPKHEDQFPSARIHPEPEWSKYSNAVMGHGFLRWSLRTNSTIAERWVRSVKEECLSHLILFGEASLRRALIQFEQHYHQERNHQGKDNVLLFPVSALQDRNAPRAIRCRERLGGLLKYYGRVA